MRIRNTFQMPNLDNLLNRHGICSDKVVVVSIIGKSSLDTFGLKVKSIGRVFSTNSQQQYLDDCVIKGSYDEEHQIVYLHLYSALDSDILIAKYFGSNHETIDDFLSTYDEIKSNFCKNVLFLLYVSHIMVLSHPGPTFDTNYIQYFKAMDVLSKNLLDKICETLQELPPDKIGTDWGGMITGGGSVGRSCTPRMIFYFERRAATGLNRTSMKKLEHNLEDKIYHILKKTRIISSTGSALFAIPLNDEFVYVADECTSATPKDSSLTEAVKGLILDCQPGGAMQLDAPFSNQPYSEKDFLKFLLVHVQQAKTKGFDDVVISTRHQHAPAHFEIPTLQQWISVAKCLYDLILNGDDDDDNKSVLCTDTRFSEQRCLKVLPLAIARYQEGLPPHYAKAEHEARLAMALGLFRAQARGPKYPEYERELQVECQAHWENGRQQCEAASMTGNPCKLPKHTSDMEHISGFIYKSVCDCGRKVGPRDDPYTALQANYIFYQQIGKECQCSKLERIEFPIFEPSIKEYKEATIVRISSSSTNNETEEVMSVLSDRSLALTPEVEKALIRRQPSSTTEYLPGMLTLNSPPGLLPVFASWSLVCLGPSSLYSHNVGLTESHHPGFLNSSNYLLPWDVTVGCKSKKAWPAITKYGNRPPPPQRRGGRPTVTIPQTVKVFIGVEYECTLGHRFMLSAPDKMLKAAPGSIVKDTGHKIAECDMPLYYSCSCRQGKVAQLMRLHVVTPKAPVYCTLAPRIQPAAGSPIFTSTCDGPTKLTQSTYWILRLPFTYVADKEHFKQNLSGKLLQGAFGVVEAD